jgi:hypothetical protein
MTSRPRGAVAAFLLGVWEILAFGLTAVGALAALLVGHWHMDSPHVSAAPADLPPPR